MKGLHLAADLTRARRLDPSPAPVHVANDADAIAAGVAATHGRLETLTRVWTIGNGIGYGRWPYVEGPWEGGHITVSLDPKERYCGCGGLGHLEGIMGNRAMRLRFLDLEPEEVFAHAKAGDPRCREFVDLWHRALAAATASFIHLAGPGRFYFTGQKVGFLELPKLRAHLESMVKMTPLQNFSLEVLPQDDEIALLGAGVSASAPSPSPNKIPKKSGGTEKAPVPHSSQPYRDEWGRTKLIGAPSFAYFAKDGLAVAFLTVSPAS